MKYHIHARLFFIIISLVMSCVLCAACAKKEGPVRAVTTFVVGSVSLERPGSPVRQLGHKEELRPGDVVRTGSGSMLVIQMGEDSVIKIEADSTVTIAAVMGKEGTRLGLEEGQVFSRLRHLQKGSDFRIYTKSCVAAVRGTEFSVSYGRGEPVVAVGDGTVEVKKAKAGKETGEARMVGAGSAAVVQEAIATRPASAEEKKGLDEFRKIEPIRDLEGASDSDIKKLQDEYMKESGAGTDAGKKEAEDSSKKEAGSSGNGSAKNVVLWTGKAVYASSDTIVVFYKDMPDYRNCWIDVSRAGDGDGRYRSYNWTYSAKSGRMEFPGLGLEPGVYEVRAHFSKSNSVDKRFRFRVQ